MIKLLSKIFSKKPTPLAMQKFLIVGLGNIGKDYENTRHNIGFSLLDHAATQWEFEYTSEKLADIGKIKFKGKQLVFIKPTTLMNRSGKAVRYWALKENIPLENILILTDDLHLPFGTLRLRTKGSPAGHNGLRDIEAHLNTPHYARLRFGIGHENKAFNQVDFVLGEWEIEEAKALPERVEKAREIIESFCLQGAQKTMNQFNGT